MFAFEARSRARFLLLALLILSLLLVVSAAAQAQSQATVCGARVIGEFSHDDPPDNWYFNGEAGQTVKISMWNTNDSGLDSRLVLRNDGGYVLGRSRGSGDAYLEATLDNAGTYSIEATRASSDVGKYSLSLICESPPPAEEPTESDDRPVESTENQAAADEPTSSDDSSASLDAIIVEGNCSLRDAIESANEDRPVDGCRAGSGADTIILRADVTLSRQLIVRSTITIEGNDHSISGGGRTRIFRVQGNGDLTINDVTLQHGVGLPEIKLPGEAAGAHGGVIYNKGKLTITGSIFSDNSASGGGAIANRGFATLTVTDSVFSGNYAEYSGGAIWNYDDDVSVTISRSEFRHNSAKYGGAILNGYGPSMRITESVFSGNAARWNGGAIANSDDVSISNSEFRRNSARDPGGAISNRGDASVSNSIFSDNSPDDCEGLTCVSVPGGGPTSRQEEDSSAVTITDNPGDSGGSATEVAVSHDQLIAVEHIACTADDIYFILRLKSDTPVSEHLFEAHVSTDGDAVLTDILPMPTVKSLPERLASVVTLTLAAEGVSAGVLATTGIPLAGTVFKAGAELGEWIDEQFTSSSSPLHFRLTWYNTDVHPGIERYLVHATRSGADSGSLRLATRLAPLTEVASWTRDVAEEDTYSTGIKNAIDVAIYWMGADPGGFGTGSELADSAIDMIASPAEWVLDKVVTGPVAYMAERFFTESGVTTAPQRIC